MLNRHALLAVPLRFQISKTVQRLPLVVRKFDPRDNRPGHQSGLAQRRLLEQMVHVHTPGLRATRNRLRQLHAVLLQHGLGRRVVAEPQRMWYDDSGLRAAEQLLGHAGVQLNGDGVVDATDKHTTHRHRVDTDHLPSARQHEWTTRISGVDVAVGLNKPVGREPRVLAARVLQTRLTQRVPERRNLFADQTRGLCAQQRQRLNRGSDFLVVGGYLERYDPQIVSRTQFVHESSLPTLPPHFGKHNADLVAQRPREHVRTCKYGHPPIGTRPFVQWYEKPGADPRFLLGADVGTGPVKRCAVTLNTNDPAGGPRVPLISG